jgi:hypothetical protein
MQTNPTHPTSGDVDPEGLGKQVATMNDRGLGTKKQRRALRRAGPLSCPPRCAHGMNSFVDTDYDLAVSRLRGA